jgi:hypothetical protein
VRRGMVVEMVERVEMAAVARAVAVRMVVVRVVAVMVAVMVAANEAVEKPAARAMAVRAVAVRVRQRRPARAAVARVATAMEVARGGDIERRGSEEGREQGGEEGGNEGVGAKATVGVGDDEGIGGAAREVVASAQTCASAKAEMCKDGMLVQGAGLNRMYIEQVGMRGKGAPATSMGRATSRSCRCMSINKIDGACAQCRPHSTGHGLRTRSTAIRGRNARNTVRMQGLERTRTRGHSERRKGCQGVQHTPGHFAF